MVRWLIRIAAGLAILAVLLVGLVQLTSTRAGPLPATAPGYAVTQVDAPLRGGSLPLFLWYPAATDMPVALVGQNALFYGFHARPDASGDGGLHPVILLSHGSGGNAPQLGWLASALAAQGYIVAATNHPGTTSNDSVPDLTVRPWERVADLTAILDGIAEAAPPGVRPDLQRVGVVGFSLGGATALLVAGARLSKDDFIAWCAAPEGKPDCEWLLAGGVDFATIDAAAYEADLRDPRVSVAVAVDPALIRAMTADSLSALPVPLTVINLGEGAGLPPAMDVAEVVASVPNAAYHAIPGAAHFSFLARCSAFGVFVIGLAGDDNICSDAGLRDRAAVQSDAAMLISAALRDRLLPR